LLTAGAALASHTTLPVPLVPPFELPPPLVPPFEVPPVGFDPPFPLPPVMEVEPPVVEVEPPLPPDELPEPPVLAFEVPAAPPGSSELFEQAALATAPAASRPRRGVTRRRRRACDDMGLVVHGTDISMRAEEPIRHKTTVFASFDALIGKRETTRSFLNRSSVDRAQLRVRFTLVRRFDCADHSRALF
jgi:hypothetical protein